MLILGLNAFHADAAACLLKDGVVVAAAEEERFRRIKHWAGFPAQAVEYVLREAGIRLAEVDQVAINQDGRANLGKKLTYLLTRRPDLAMVMDRLRHRRERMGVAEHLALNLPGQPLSCEVLGVEHHQAHLRSAFEGSPFERALAVSVDGFGDFASAAWGLGEGRYVGVDDRVYFPHSLGLFYQAMTQFLGFWNYGDEYKAMGLAPYGKPTFLARLREVVCLEPNGQFRLNLRYFRHHRERIEFDWESSVPTFSALYSSELEQLLGPARLNGQALDDRHADLACSVQAMYEEALFHLLRALHLRYRTDALVLSGGCAMNSVANGKILGHTAFKKVYVPAAAGDAGGAVGAALEAWRQGEGASAPRQAYTRADWGPAFDEVEIARAVEAFSSQLAFGGCTVRQIEDTQALCHRVAFRIARGAVVGWFQGRMEWGPRALGQRSILGDPRRPDMKDILNHKVKRRESFRPFAPSVLREYVSDWFEVDADVPFMTHVLPIRYARRERIPAVTHVDGTGRLQTVCRDDQPHYHALISEFYRLTGVPMLLNTSFNENEPVVCRPEEALDCFVRTRMDMLVLGNTLIERAQAEGGRVSEPLSLPQRALNA